MRGKELAIGGEYVRKDGYLAVKVGIRRYQLKHRLVMERFLCRRLKADEHVHHLNGDRTDNRLENLVLLTSAEHSKIHAAIRQQE